MKSKFTIFLALVFVAFARFADATVYTVNSNADPGAGVGTSGSLRYCITTANADPAVPHTLVFAIGAGAVTISLGSPLPQITRTLNMNGTTQPGWTPATGPIVTLDGPGFGTGLDFNGAPSSLITGFILTDFGDPHINVNNSASMTIQGNYIGNNGVIAGTNSYGDGIVLTSSSNSVIGGNIVAAPFLKNVISGRDFGVRIFTSVGCVIQGNYFGLNAAGNTAMGNSNTAIEVNTGCSNTKIGGSVDGEGNVIGRITGNHGIMVSSHNNLIQGNYIGLDAAGTAAMPIATNGIYILNGWYNLIGGTTSVERNVIANCNTYGILLENGGSKCRANRVYNNYIGVDKTGNVSQSNNNTGVRIKGASYNFIGWTGANQGNVISSNKDCGVVMESDCDSNTVAGNYIGLGANGTTVLVNGTGTNHHGIYIQGSGSSYSSIKNNVIVSPGRGCGLSIDANCGSYDTISYNYFGTDASGGTNVGIGNTNAEHGIVIKGTAVNETISFNIIGGVKGDGVKLDGGTFTNALIQGNYIGTDVTGLIKFAVGTNTTNSGFHTNNADLTTFRFLDNVVAGSAGYGVWLDGGAATNVTIKGNIIGMDKNGTATTFGNVSAGLYIHSGSGSNLIIGGTTAAERNVISNNGRNAANSCAAPESGGGIVITNINGITIQGNYIGVDATGNVAAGNGNSGITLNGGNSNVLIGGSAAGAGNVLSANGFFCTGAGGVRHGAQWVNANGTNNRAEGNYVGLGADGTTALGNAGEGLSSYACPNITIGGTTAGQRNVIGSNNIGVYFQPGSATNCKVIGNYIGTDYTGTLLRPNVNGVHITDASGDFIGGPNAGEGNVINNSTNNGILLDNADNTVIQQNIIRGNAGDGIRIQAGGVGTTGVLIGSATNTSLGNTISYNFNGVNITEASSQRDAIRRNSIFCNTNKGINLNSVGNINIQITALTSASPYITAPTPGINDPNITNQVSLAVTDVIEVFWDNSSCGTCQGRTYLGDATGLTAGGDWVFSPLPAASDCTPKGGASCLVGVTNITATRTDNLGNTSEFMSCTPLALPVSYISFTVQRSSSDDVLLEWATASEKDNAYFEILRSTDGTSFIPVGIIAGAINSNTVNNYSFTDEGLMPGVYYYILNQIDVDGKQSLSPVRSVNLTDAGAIEIIPTSVSQGDQVKVLNLSGENIFSISLIDMTGKVLIENRSVKGVENFISTAGLASGMYVVRVETASEVILKKVFIY
jgi:hypothetical protein